VNVNEPIALLLGSGGGAALIYAIVALVKAIQSRKIVSADAVDKFAVTAGRLAGNAVEMIEAARKDAEHQIAQARTDAATSVAAALQDVDAARRDAAEARREASDARREATNARNEAAASNLFMRRLVVELFRADATVERLRRLVSDNGGEPSTLNGTSH